MPCHVVWLDAQLVELIHGLLPEPTFGKTGPKFCLPQAKPLIQL